MAIWHYKKYVADFRYTEQWSKTTYTHDYTFWPPGVTYEPETTNPSLEWGMVAEALGINRDTGFYPVVGKINKKLADYDYLRSSAEYLVIDAPDTAYTCQANGDQRVSDARRNSNAARWPSNKYTLGKVYSRGAYVGEAVGGEGEYPLNGRSEADGYWYVRDDANDDFAARMSVRAGGRWADATPFVRVNGVWIQAEPGVLAGANLFSVDGAGNAQIAAASHIEADGGVRVEAAVNVYYGGYAEV